MIYLPVETSKEKMKRLNTSAKAGQVWQRSSYDICNGITSP